jgi:NAD(P)-dependent dehydrogenase (short-subunit alcohol dehydrogenase family)
MTTHKIAPLTGKTCLITGSSRGIGYETAAGLARMGAHVIIVSHNQERCQAAYDRITAEFGQERARYYTADLSVQDDVRQLAEDIQQDYDVLDVMVNNVGGWYRKFELSADGIEMTFALNHLSYWLLTGSLLHLLQKSTSARIINVSSDAHFQAKGIHFDDVQFKQRYNAFKVYAHSKLANVLFTYELARRLSGTDLTVNALHPGFVRSELYRHFGIITPLVNLIARAFGKSAAEGAQTSIYLSSDQEVVGITKEYFSECQPKNSSPASYDESQAKRLWALSEAMTGFTYRL